MSYKLRQMERVKRMREARERIGEASLAAATAKLHDAEQRLAFAREAEMIGAQEAVHALEAGDKPSMLLALRKPLGMDCERYEKECNEREEEVQQAQVILCARRLESEQAVLLHRDMRSGLLQQEERRAQTETVDRFLARSRWNSAKVRVRSLSEAV